MAKQIHAVYFSATYNSRKYARAVAGAFGLPVAEYDLTGPNRDESLPEIAADDIVIFSAPVFAGRIPPLAAGRFARFKGSDGPALTLVTYGNREYDDALLELADLARQNGFALLGAAAFIGRHSLLPHNAAGRPSEADLAAAAAFGQKCAAKLAAGSLPELKIRGNFPYKELGPAAPWLPYGTEQCNACQTCVRLCPVGAIPADDPHTTGPDCFRCGRCFAVCPQGARQIPAPVFQMMRERIDPLASGHKEAEWFL